MRIPNGFLVAVLHFALCLAGMTAHAQPTVPKDKIPSDLSQDLRTQIERLYSEDPVQRGNAVVSLGQMGSRAAPAVAFLVAMGHDHAPLRLVPMGVVNPDGEIARTSPAREAMNALVKIGKVAVEPLIVALRDPDAYVRDNAVSALIGIDDSRALEPVISVMGDPDENVRQNAAVAVAVLGARSVERILAVLKSPDPNVRIGAAHALSMIREERAVGPLTDALKDSDANVRKGAADALGKIGPAAVEPLVALSKDSDPVARTNAAYALGAIADIRAVESLICLLHDSEQSVRQAASSALNTLTGESFGEDQAKWREWLKKKAAPAATP